MILPIYTYGEKILLEKGDLVTKDHENLKETIENMFETMVQAGGIGLAAQQIGLNLQMFVIDLSGYENIDSNLKDFKKVFINPEIIETSDETLFIEEGCLSFPWILLKVNRPESVKLKYFDSDFDEHEEWFDKLAARCILHEYDHIQGITLINHMSPLKKNIVRNKLDLIIKKSFVANYKIKK